MAISLVGKWYVAMVIACDPQMTKADGAVAMTLLNFLNNAGEAWPSLNTLAQRTRLNRSSVCRSVKRLVEARYLERVAGGGRRHSTTYRLGRRASEIASASRQKSALETVTAEHQIVPENCGGDALQRSQKCTESVASLHPYPSYEIAHERAQEERDFPVATPSAVEPRGDCAEEMRRAVQIYNAVAAEHGWPKCAAITPTRTKRLAARLNDVGGMAGWRVALEKAIASDFLMGRTPRDEKHKNWKLDFDFLLRESSFTNLMEGKYDNRKPTPRAHVGTGKGSEAPTKDERRAAIFRGARAVYGMDAGGAASGDTEP